MRWRYAVAGLAAAALATLTAGCQIHVSSSSSEERSYQVSGVVDRVVLTNQSGRVDVLTGSGPIRVTETLVYTTTRPSTSHITDGGTLRLANDGCRRSSTDCEVRYRIQVPASTDIDLTNREGPITLSGLAGDISVVSTDGPVDGVELTSATAKVRTTDGRISLRFLAPPSTVSTENMDGITRIRLPGSTSYAVDARSDDGNIAVRVPTDGASTHRITAHATGLIDVDTI